MPTTSPKAPQKLDSTIRSRVEPELKRKLEEIAIKRRKKFSVFMREEMWRLVDIEEAAKKARR